MLYFPNIYIMLIVLSINFINVMMGQSNKHVMPLFQDEIQVEIKLSFHAKW